MIEFAETKLGKRLVRFNAIVKASLIATLNLRSMFYKAGWLLLHKAGFRKIRRALIDKNMRDKFELYGASFLSMILAGNKTNHYNQDGDLGAILLNDEPRKNLLLWLQEQRDVEANHECRVEWLEWAILIFVGAELGFDIWHSLPVKLIKF